MLGCCSDPKLARLTPNDVKGLVRRSASKSAAGQHPICREISRPLCSRGPVVVDYERRQAKDQLPPQTTLALGVELADRFVPQAPLLDLPPRGNRPRQLVHGELLI